MSFPMIGMAPTVWGPIFWTTMHIVSLGYSPNPSKEEQTAAIQFYRSLEFVIPCPICRAHYSKFLKDMPVENHVANRDALVKWLFDIHNHVNKQLGKSEITWEQYIEQIKKLQAMPSLTFYEQPQSTMLPMIAAGIGGIIVGIAGYYAVNHIVKK